MTAPRTIAGALRAGLGPLVQIHARTIMAGVGARVFAVMVLVEAVFLAERFPIVFRAVFKNHADLADTTLIFLGNTTQVFDLALAIAILLAVYWTVLRMRENRELLVLFAAGSGPYQLLAVIFLIAVAGQIGSLVVSGVLDPAARFSERRILFDAEFRALRNGINTGQFYTFPSRVAFAPARTAAGPERTRNLFLYENIDAAKFRVITADRAVLDGPDAQGILKVRLGGFTSQMFSRGRQPAPTRNEATSGVHLSAIDVTREFRADELLRLDPRGSVGEEMTIFEQLHAPPDAGKRHLADMRLLGERAARSLLCLLAPLLALAAVRFTFRGTDYLILPAACMVLMALNMMSGWMVKLIAPTEPLVAFGVPAAITTALIAVLLAEIIREQGLLARPQLARP